jgi:hypothetical protein
MKNNIPGVFARFYRVSAKSNLKFTPELTETPGYLPDIFDDRQGTIGLILGDLHAEKRNLNSNTRLQFKQSSKNKDYVDHLYNLFKEYCGSEPTETSWFDSRPNKNKTYSSIKFSTFSLPCFNVFRSMFYSPSSLGTGTQQV